MPRAAYAEMKKGTDFGAELLEIVVLTPGFRGAVAGFALAVCALGVSEIATAADPSPAGESHA
jgi:hypothetical protein